MEEMKLKRKIAEILGVDVILEVEAKDIMLDVNALKEANIKLNIVEDMMKKTTCDIEYEEKNKWKQ